MFRVMFAVSFLRWCSCSLQGRLSTPALAASRGRKTRVAVVMTGAAVVILRGPWECSRTSYRRATWGSRLPLSSSRWDATGRPSHERRDEAGQDRGAGTMALRMRRPGCGSSVGPSREMTSWVPARKVHEQHALICRCVPAPSGWLRPAPRRQAGDHSSRLAQRLANQYPPHRGAKLRALRRVRPFILTAGGLSSGIDWRCTWWSCTTGRRSRRRRLDYMEYQARAEDEYGRRRPSRSCRAYRSPTATTRRSAGHLPAGLSEA